MPSNDAGRYSESQPAKYHGRVRGRGEVLHTDRSVTLVDRSVTLVGLVSQTVMVRITAKNLLYLLGGRGGPLVQSLSRTLYCLARCM